MRKPQVEDHWHSLIEGFATSSLDFYELVKCSRAIVAGHSQDSAGMRHSLLDVFGHLVLCTKE
jgi:hypothetical protein